MHGQMRNRLSVEANVAGIWSHQTHHLVEGSGLAGAIGPEQAHNFSAIYLDGDVIHHVAAAVALYQILGLDH